MTKVGLKLSQFVPIALRFELRDWRSAQNIGTGIEFNSHYRKSCDAEGALRASTAALKLVAISKWFLKKIHSTAESECAGLISLQYPLETYDT